MVKIKPIVNSLFYSKKYKEVGTITRIILAGSNLKISVSFVTDNKETICATTDELLHDKTSNTWHKIV
tara:strand:+ start:276 stop:479 length:204 start_codon:yes stop_codon:yes gene_type:complete